MELKDLAKPFSPNDIEWRMQQSGIGNNGKPWGMCLAYVTNRAIMDRLDEVCGPENWKNEFMKGPDGGTLCGISIYLAIGVGLEPQWVTKWDGAPNTDIESVKGGLSNAMKRAAVQWGIGRYLYNLETGWAVFKSDGKYNAKMKDNSYHKWNPPALPDWAVPAKSPIDPEPYLEQMKWFAKHEGVIYKKILNFWQVDTAKAIENPESQQKIIQEIEAAIKAS